MPVNPKDMQPGKPPAGEPVAKATPQPQPETKTAPVVPPQPQSAPTPTPDPALAEPKWKPNKIVVFLIGFAISLALGWLFQQFTDRDALEGAKEAQQGWRTAVESTQPFAILGQYWDDVQLAFKGSDSMNGGHGAGLGTPIFALFMTGARLWDAGGFWAIIQLLLGGLALAVYNNDRTKGQSIFFESMPMNVVVTPFLVIGIASVISLILQIVMTAALGALGWITDLAAAAAGASGVVGFCWYCFTELGKKGAEHVITPKFGG